MKKETKQALLFASIVTIVNIILTIKGKDEIINFPLLSNSTLNTITNIILCFIILFLISFVVEKIASMISKKLEINKEDKNK